MARRGAKLALTAAAFLAGILRAAAEDRLANVDSIRDVLVRMRGCWKPPALSKAQSTDITVIVSFNRRGEILGRPRITFETAAASDNDRLQYRIAVMEALQRCTPLPFTEAMAGAAAGRPFAIQFQGPKRSPQPTERRA